MSIGVPKEVEPREKRVAQTPDTVGKLAKLGITVNVEAGAGEASKCSDERYAAAGAKIVDRDAVRSCCSLRDTSFLKRENKGETPCDITMHVQQAVEASLFR